MEDWKIGPHIDDGIYILLKEVLDNSIDEFIMHHGNQINIAFESFYFPDFGSRSW